MEERPCWSGLTQKMGLCKLWVMKRNKNNRSKFLCLDCNVDTARQGELYMLIDETWKLTGLGKIGMLCVGHVEERIGRRLIPSDFNDSYLNKPRTSSISVRLLSRMRGVDNELRTT